MSTCFNVTQPIPLPDPVRQEIPDTDFTAQPNRIGKTSFFITNQLVEIASTSDGKRKLFTWKLPRFIYITEKERFNDAPSIA